MRITASLGDIHFGTQLTIAHPLLVPLTFAVSPQVTTSGANTSVWWYRAALVLIAVITGILVDAVFLTRARRRKAEAALRASEVRNSALLRAIPDLMFVHSPDGVYLDYHAKDPAELLVPPEQFLGKRISDIMPPALQEMFQRCFDEASQTGGPAVAEYELTVHGEQRHYEVRIVRRDDGALVSIVRDVTEWKRVTEQLRKSEEFNRRIIESSSDGIKVLDLDARLKWMSRTALQQVELEEFTIENLRILDHLSDADRRAAERAFALARSGEPGTYRASALTTKGTPKVWDVVVTPMTDSQGNVTSLLAVSRDITERKKAEEALRDAQAELARASRAMALGALTTSIAHEVGQPLGALLVNARAAERYAMVEPPDLAAVRHVIREIAQNAKRATDVVARVRQLFANAPIKRSLLDLNELIDDVVGAVSHESLQQGVAIRTDLDPRLPPVSGDRVQIQQVLLNLLRNGVEAMSQEVDVARAVVVRSRRVDPTGAEVAVIDSGSGFRPEDAERIFEPFYTTKTQGMGLGLAMSRMIVGAHGGKLTASRNSDRGATFRFVLGTAATNDSAVTSELRREEHGGRSAVDPSTLPEYSPPAGLPASAHEGS